MKRPREITIDQFQLDQLLSDEQKNFFTMVMENNVFCVQCGGVAEAGIAINDMFLTSLNDIFVKGTCKKCKGNVARTLEFGEERGFFEKANEFRKSIRN